MLLQPSSLCHLSSRLLGICRLQTGFSSCFSWLQLESEAAPPSISTSPSKGSTSFTGLILGCPRALFTSCSLPWLLPHSLALHSAIAEIDETRLQSSQAVVVRARTQQFRDIKARRPCITSS